MTSNEQRAALQRKIWDIANDVRGAVDGWDFKQYVLGACSIASSARTSSTTSPAVTLPSITLPWQT